MGLYYGLLSFIIISIFSTLKNYKMSKLLTFISFIYIVIIQGLRKITVGTDLQGGYILGLEIAKYLNFFKGDKLLNFEKGYSLYCQIFSKLNFSDQGYLFVVSLTIMFPIFYIILKNSKLPLLSSLIYVTFGFFTFSFSGLRQAIAIGITFLSFEFIKKKKKFYFILFCFLAMSFHKSAFIFLIAYPLYNLNIKKKYLLFMGFLFSFVFIFRNKIFILFYKLYKGIPGEIEVTNAYSMLILMIFILIISYILVRKNYEKINGYRNFLMMTICLQIFASVYSIAMRLGYYYYIFLVLLIPEIISQQRNKKNRLIMISILILFSLYFFQKNTGSGYLNVSPYYFYWE